MKLNLYTFSFIVISILALSCKTASKLYEKGRYDEAVELAAKKLQKDPNDRKLLDVLQNAYRFAVDDHESRIRNYAAGNNDLKWEWTYNEYTDLQRLYESIRRSPDVFNLVKPTDYSSYVTMYREKAGEARYDRGMALMSLGTKKDYRSAYREFQSALAYIPGDLDIRQRMDEAYANAVINVVILPLEERSSYQYSSYNSRYLYFDDNTLQYLKNNNSNPFIKFFSSQEVRSRNIRVDHVVDVRFASVNIGRQSDDLSTRTVSKDVVVKETVHRPDSITKEYAKVTAKITTTKRSIRSEGNIRVAIRDENNMQVWSDQYSGQHYWSTEFASYTGDSRALSESDRELVNRSQQTPPREEEMIKCIMDELQSKVECGIRDYFYRLQ